MSSEVTNNTPEDLSRANSTNILQQEPNIRDMQGQEAVNSDTPVNDLQKSGNRSTQRKFIAEASFPKINPPDLHTLQDFNKLRDRDGKTESAIEKPLVRISEANVQGHIQQGSKQLEAEKDKESSPKDGHEIAAPLLRQEAAIKAMDDVNQALDKAVQSIKGVKDTAEPLLRQEGAVKAIDDASQTPNKAIHTAKDSQETHESSSEQQEKQAREVVRQAMQAYNKAIQAVERWPIAPAGQLVETEKVRIQSPKNDNEMTRSYVQQKQADAARHQAMQASKHPLSPITPAQQQIKASDLLRLTKITFKGFGTINVKSLKTLS
ncbi:MAG: hypothetical protein HYZ47_00235 [Simkania negevensis]|nr:hypothetical protein [Simkania negevensis]